MTVTERVAYIRGLFEGLDINTDKKEGRVLLAMLDVLEDMALSIADLEDENDALQNIIDTMLEDLYDDDDSYDEEDLYEDEDDLDSDTELFQVVCPSCGEEIFVDETTLAMSKIDCPACGEELEFDFSALEADELPADLELEDDED
ncbi:MAG: CD1247 N-terminal domain-containing protein [Butyricicoccus sp.]